MSEKDTEDRIRIEVKGNQELKNSSPHLNKDSPDLLNFILIQLKYATDISPKASEETDPPFGLPPLGDRKESLHLCPITYCIKHPRILL